MQPSDLALQRIWPHPPLQTLCQGRLVGPGGESWHEVSGNLPSDFGFPISSESYPFMIHNILYYTHGSLIIAPNWSKTIRFPSP